MEGLGELGIIIHGIDQFVGNVEVGFFLRRLDAPFGKVLQLGDIGANSGLEFGDLFVFGKV